MSPATLTPRTAPRVRRRNHRRARARFFVVFFADFFADFFVPFFDERRPPPPERRPAEPRLPGLPPPASLTPLIASAARSAPAEESKPRSATTRTPRTAAVHPR